MGSTAQYKDIRRARWLRENRFQKKKASCGLYLLLPLLRVRLRLCASCRQTVPSDISIQMAAAENVCVLVLTVP